MISVTTFQKGETYDPAISGKSTFKILQFRSIPISTKKHENHQFCQNVIENSNNFIIESNLKLIKVFLLLKIEKNKLRLFEERASIFAPPYSPPTQPKQRFSPSGYAAKQK